MKKLKLRIANNEMKYDIFGISEAFNHALEWRSRGADSMIQRSVSPAFRIRKLTPRECFRLMDVDDKDIDTIQAAGISDSQQYKLAGNSIVVNVLTEIFRKLLVDTQNDDRQLRMF